MELKAYFETLQLLFRDEFNEEISGHVALMRHKLARR
jgi:hypothetical protein